ncbi:MAG: hypothetical protein NC225_01460 [Clostridium sp.]|nr:hypothetical protein [Clostridium sp.]MCM1398128.1 hypothetical protein [Clostridium sp.]MCM1460870.1 hypothetical protein [Bacteroides sp.]
MSFKNVFHVSLKRMLLRKLYIFILAVLVLLTAVYQLLPMAGKSSDINVAVYIEDNSSYADMLADKTLHSTSVYHFYMSDNVEQLITDVKSGNAECGIVVPTGFMDGYITGNIEQKLSVYTVPGTTLASTVTETFFSYIYSICATDILLHAIGTPALNDGLVTAITTYLSSDEIFRIEDVSTGTYSSTILNYHIKLPVHEAALCLIIFAGLLGLLTYMTDSERSIFIALPNTTRLLVLTANVAAAILPICLVSVACCLLTYGRSIFITNIIICSFVAALASIVLQPIIRKSTTLSKVLPIIMLGSIVLVFAATLL